MAFGLAVPEYRLRSPEVVSQCLAVHECTLENYDSKNTQHACTLNTINGSITCDDVHPFPSEHCSTTGPAKQGREAENEHGDLKL